ncbi:MAG TPA: hypothetical protein VGB71_18385, partial [Flavisolibacter sp.]
MNGILFLLVSCPLLGQVKQKKELTRADYHLWNTIVPHAISEKGNWVSYTISYNAHPDTLFVKSTASNKLYTLPNCEGGEFYREQSILYFAKDYHLQILNLKTGKTEDIAGVTSYRFLNGGKNILLAYADGRLVVRTIDGKILTSINNVSEWVLNNNSSEVAVVRIDGTISSIGLVIPGQHNKVISTATDLKYHNIVWSKNDEVLTFFGTNESNKIYSYNLISSTRSEFDAASDKSFPEQMEVITGLSALEISDDGRFVFFRIRNKNMSVHNPDEVQVWNTKDKLLYPETVLLGPAENRAFNAVWNVKNGTWRQLTDRSLPRMMMNATKTVAFVYDPNAYEPQFKHMSDVDFYRLDLETGGKKIVLEKALGYDGNFVASPGGKYMAYFKDFNWWVYDIELDAHTNVTSKIHIDLYKYDYLEEEGPTAYGVAGWTPLDKQILIYDKFDV